MNHDTPEAIALTDKAAAGGLLVREKALQVNHTCCANVPYGNWGRTKQCTFKAKVTEEGKPYCMVHAPSVMTKKWEEKTAAWEAEKNARQSARDAQKEIERRADCYTELLEALQEMVKQFTKTPSTLADTNARIKAHKAIAKATGAPA